MSSSTTYSLNVRVILFPLKFLVFGAGLAFNKWGGMVSLGPPVGAPIWAQPEPPVITAEVIRIKRKEKNMVEILICRFNYLQT